MSKQKIKLAYCIVLYTFTTILCPQTCHGRKAASSGLYDNNTDIISLSPNVWDEKILGSESAWLVEFYNSWCGHCIKFAPQFKVIANRLLDWWPVLQVGAINCAEENNRDLCRTHGIKGVPSFKVIPPYYQENGTTSEIFHNQDEAVIAARILDLITNTSLVQPPPTWPRLEPIMSMHEIWEEVNDDHVHVAFVFEKEESWLGASVILDTSHYKALLVRRMNQGGVKKFGVVHYPSLYLIHKNGTFTRIAKSNSTREGMTAALKGLLTPQQLEAGNQYLQQRQKTLVHQALDPGQAVGPVHTDTKAAVYMADLESTLHYTFRQEIAICQKIAGDKLKALRLFLNALVKYFPSRDVVKNFLEKVSSWLNNIGTEITGDLWLSTIDRLQTQDAYLPERIEWVGCAGSEARYRGYPCGMWTLFHTITVGAFEYNRANPRDLPMDILTTIQGYMKYFFGCETCVNHFLKMAATITPSDSKPREAALWLWQAHNKANLRLHGDASEDPFHPKVQFPPKSLCQECYADDSDAKFNKNEVLSFLVSFYGQSGIIPLANENSAKDDGKIADSSAVNNKKALDWWELQQRKKDLEKIQSLRKNKKAKLKQLKESKQNAVANVNLDKSSNSFDEFEKASVEFQVQVSSRGFFSNLDVSLCATFYMLCTFIIIFLYYHFIVRKKYKPWASFTYSKVKS